MQGQINRGGREQQQQEEESNGQQRILEIITHQLDDCKVVLGEKK